MKKIYSYLRKATNDRLRGALLLLGGLLLFGVQGLKADERTVTVYYAIHNDQVGTKTVKLNVNRKGDGDDWQQVTMSKSSNQYRGWDIYSASYTEKYGGIGVMQFQLFTNPSDVDPASQQQPVSSWNTTDFDGMMYIHNKGWLDFGIKGAWDEWAAVTKFNSTDQATINLKAKTGYEFKVTNIFANSWYGWNTSTSNLITNTTVSSVIDNTDGSAGTAYLTSTIAGSYIFEWNPISSTITVTYPTEYSRTGLSAGAYGTICLPVAATIKNSCATLYSIVDKNAQGVIIQETGSSILAAGKPYIFKLGADKTTFEVTLDNTSNPVASSLDNGLVGNYEDNHAVEYVESTANYYILSGGEVRKAVSGCSVDSHRAFIDLDGITTLTYAPGRPIIAMPLEPNNATDINSIEAGEKAVKFFQDGKLFILRDGVTYDATGRIVK